MKLFSLQSFSFVLTQFPLYCLHARKLKKKKRSSACCFKFLFLWFQYSSMFPVSAQVSFYRHAVVVPSDLNMLKTHVLVIMSFWFNWTMQKWKSVLLLSKRGSSRTVVLVITTLKCRFPSWFPSCVHLSHRWGWVWDFSECVWWSYSVCKYTGKLLLQLWCRIQRELPMWRYEAFNSKWITKHCKSIWSYCSTQSGLIYNYIICTKTIIHTSCCFSLWSDINKCPENEFSGSGDTEFQTSTGSEAECEGTFGFSGLSV